MKALTGVAAPAKINLFLHITGRRSDGYHNIQSVFTLLDLADTLDFEMCQGQGISREDTTHTTECEPLPTEDLCVRAAKLLQAKTGCAQGAHIRLTKRIPSQAGLGGGSSDAATCLLALNRLWNTGLDRASLMGLAAQLGADVPFFVFGQPAWAEGTGDQLQAITCEPMSFLLVKPPQGLATNRIFSDPALKRNTKPATIKGFAEHTQSGSQTLFGANDLQPVAEKLCPQVRQAIFLLKEAGLSARMTGSGSAVFAPLVAPQQVTNLPADWFAKHCSSLTEHPLKNWAL